MTGPVHAAAPCETEGGGQIESGDEIESDRTPRLRRPSLSQTRKLFALLGARDIRERDVRLAWASGLCGRRIASFRDLSGDDVRHLLDLLDSDNQ